jgi:hypothetical protein
MRPYKNTFAMGFLRDWSLERRFGGRASIVPLVKATRMRPYKNTFAMGSLRDWFLKRRFGGGASNVPLEPPTSLLVPPSAG